MLSLGAMRRIVLFRASAIIPRLIVQARGRPYASEYIASFVSQNVPLLSVVKLLVTAVLVSYSNISARRLYSL